MKLPCKQASEQASKKATKQATKQADRQATDIWSFTLSSALPGHLSGTISLGTESKNDLPVCVVAVLGVSSTSLHSRAGRLLFEGCLEKSIALGAESEWPFPEQLVAGFPVLRFWKLWLSTI